MKIKWRKMSNKKFFIESKEKVSYFSKNKEYKQIGTNILSLTLLNVISYISPLLLIPYLIRVIGAEKYGIYIFAWTFVSYFVYLVNYGFDFTATKQIAINKDNPNEISKIFSSVIIIRISITILCLLSVILSINFIPFLFTYKTIIANGLGIILGIALFPTWLFQGMEEMKFITIVNIIIRLIPLLLVFVFIKNANQYENIILIQSLGYIIGGLFSIVFGMKHYNIRFKLPSLVDLYYQLKEGWTLFLSTVGMTLYRESNVFILGITTGNYTSIGYYSMADKIIRFAQTLALPIAQSLFPFFGRNFHHNRENSFHKMAKIGKVYFILLFLISLFILLFIKPSLGIYLGGNYPDVLTNIYIMLPIVIISGFNYLYGIVGLVNLGYQRAFTLFVLAVGLINIVSCIGLSETILLEKGASISLLLSECILCILVLIYYRNINKKKTQIS